MTDPLNLQAVIGQAGRAIARIDRHGRRGVSMVTYGEVEAMAVLLAALGCPSIPDNATAEDIEAPLARFLARLQHLEGDQT